MRLIISETKNKELKTNVTKKKIIIIKPPVILKTGRFDNIDSAVMICSVYKAIPN